MKEYKKNKTNPISEIWYLESEICFIKTNPFPPFFSKFQGSPKLVFLYSCILTYLFYQNEPCAKRSWCNSAGLNLPGQRIASRPEYNYTYKEVTNYAKLWK